MKLVTKIAIFFAVCVAGVLVYLLLRKPKSKDPPSADPYNPIDDAQFKNNYCRAINNPYFRDNKWVSGDCHTTINNEKELLCGATPDGIGKYTTLCNAYGSKKEGHDKTKVGACCALTPRYSLEDGSAQSNRFMKNFCEVANGNNDSYWIKKDGDCKSGDTKSLNDAYNKNGFCCIPKPK